VVMMRRLMGGREFFIGVAPNFRGPAIFPPLAWSAGPGLADRSRFTLVPKSPSGPAHSHPQDGKPQNTPRPNPPPPLPPQRNVDQGIRTPLQYRHTRPSRHRAHSAQLVKKPITIITIGVATVMSSPSMHAPDPINVTRSESGTDAFRGDTDRSQGTCEDPPPLEGVSVLVLIALFVHSHRHRRHALLASAWQSP